MKTLIAKLAAVTFAILFFALQGKATDLVTSHDSTEVKTLADAKLLLNRLDIINATDKTNFSASRKKELRKETRQIKGHLRALRGSSNLPAWAILIILIIPFATHQVME
jgi:hypothetical protein